jgi:hypothetical protein
MIDSYLKTTEGVESTMKVYVHEGDKFISKYREIFKGFKSDKVTIEFGPYKTMVKVLNDYCKQHPEMEYFSEVNDDHIFVTPGWDIKMMSACKMKNNGMSVVYGKTQQFPTATMHGAKLIKFLGYFFPPEYSHMCVDLWLMDFGFEADLMVYTPDVLIEHMHHAFAKNYFNQDVVVDESYIVGAHEDSEGKRIYHEWEKTNKTKDISRVRAAILKEKIIDKKDFPDLKNERITTVLTAYDRVGLLQRTVISYLSSNRKPESLYIFIDKGPEFDRVLNICASIPEAKIIIHDELQGCATNIYRVKKFLFEHNANIVISIDSDGLFNPDWYKKTEEICDKVDLGKDIVCLFNARVHPHWNLKDGLVEKEYIGDHGMICSSVVWEKCFDNIHREGNMDGWDGHFCHEVVKNGGRVLACSPSYLQHTGGKTGTHAHIDATECIADDFIGEEKDHTEIVSKSEVHLYPKGYNLKPLTYVEPVDEAHPIKMRYIGTSLYKGFDDNGRKEIQCKEMGVVNVSKQKAQQLLKDFPQLWVHVGSLPGVSIW